MILAMRLPLRLGVCMRKRRVRCLVSGGDGGALKNPGSATVGPAGAQMVFHSDCGGGLLASTSRTWDLAFYT